MPFFVFPFNVKKCVLIANKIHSNRGKRFIRPDCQKKSKGSMSQLIHALGMKLRERVSSKVVYKVILVAHLEAIV